MTRTGARPSPAQVLHVLPDLAIGGGQTVVLDHLRHVDHDRYDASVAALDARGPMMGPVEAASGRPVLDLRSRGRGRALAAVLRLAAGLRRRSVDLVHVHSDEDRKVGQLAALVCRVPVVGHLHAEWVHLGPRTAPRPSRWRQARARVVAAARDLVERRTVRHYVATSELVRQLFAPLVDQPISVMHHGIDLDRFPLDEGVRRSVRRDLGVAEAAPVLVCVARLAEGKGQGTLLDLVARLRPARPDLVLVLAGDGPLRDGLEARAADLGLADAVHFLGVRDDVPALLASADVFVFASENEGYGLAVLEAMAAALPVVAMHCGSLEEFVVPHETGELVPAGDLDAMAVAVDDLLARPDHGRRLGAAGRAVVADRFDPTAVARSLEAVYDEVLGR